jgi:hypothetical protein
MKMIDKALDSKIAEQTTRAKQFTISGYFSIRIVACSDVQGVGVVHRNCRTPLGQGRMANLVAPAAAIVLCFFLIQASLYNGSFARSQCDLEQGGIQDIMLTMSESYDKVQLSWTVKISDSAKKLYYAVHHHHWTSPQHVPNAAQFVSSSNRTNMSYWEPLRRLKWRSVNQRYRTTFRDLTRSTYHAFEIAIGTRSDFKRGMPCLKNLSEVVYTGHHRLSVTVVEDEFTVTPMNPRVVKCGSDLTLKCVASGQPPPHKTYWFRRGLYFASVLVSNANPELLQLRNVQPSDTGNYICISENYEILYNFSQHLHRETTEVSIEVRC